MACDDDSNEDALYPVLPVKYDETEYRSFVSLKGTMERRFNVYSNI